MEIPKQLKDCRFCKIKTQTKIPYEMGWQKEPYYYNQINPVESENYGVVCGFNDLAVIDCDKQSLREMVNATLPETFSVLTGSGGTHFYYFVPDLKKKIILSKNGEHFGEIQSYGSQVVGAGSIHPNGKEYEIQNNVSIKTISLKEIEQALSVFFVRDEQTFLQDNNNWGWLIEQAIPNWKEGDRQNKALCLAGYLRKNKGLGIETIKSIITEICKRTEDNELSMRLRAVDETFKKNETEIKGYTGLKFLDEKQDKEVKFEVYTDKDLREYIPEPTKWLIENQIPKGEIGLLVGKRGRKKTFVGLRQAISLASGKDCLEDRVPEKRKIFFIDEESGKNEIAKRTKLLKAGLGINEDLDITFLSFENIKLNDTSSLKYKAFEELVLNLKPDLIIVDCLQRCVNFEVDRDNQSISEFFTGVVRQFTKTIGCSWLFIHHMRKGNPQNKVEDSLDEIRGGSELVNYCRYVLMVDEPRKKSKEEKSLGIFEVIKMSNSQIPPSKVFEFKANLDLISMNYLGSPEEILNTEAKIGNAIKEYIIENELIGEFHTKDIIDNAQKIGFKRSSLSVGLKWLENNNMIVKEKRGIWRLTSDEELQGGLDD